MNDSDRIASNVQGHDLSRLTPTTKIITGANPAANAEATFGTVPAGKVWRILMASISCAQGATQTPSPALSITDGTTIVGLFPGSTAAVSVSTTSRFTWAVGLTVITAGAALVANFAPLPNPPLMLPAGYVLATLTGGIGAGTDYAAGSLLVVEYG